MVQHGNNGAGRVAVWLLMVVEPGVMEPGAKGKEQSQARGSN